MAKGEKSKEIGERALKIIEVWGSSGMPSCGGSHDGQQVEFVGGATEEIKPGTPRWNVSIFLNSSLFAI